MKDAEQSPGELFPGFESGLYVEGTGQLQESRGPDAEPDGSSVGILHRRKDSSDRACRSQHMGEATLAAKMAMFREPCSRILKTPGSTADRGVP